MIDAKAFMEFASTLMGGSTEFVESKKEWHTRGQDYELRTSDDHLQLMLEFADVATAGPGASVSWHQSLEILVREESAGIRPPAIRRGKSIELHDSASGYSYRLGEPTDKFLSWRICELAQDGALNQEELMTLGVRTYMGEIKGSIFDGLRVYFRYISLQVASKNPASVKKMSELGDAALFQLAYNMNIACAPMAEFDDFPARRTRTTRRRRVALEDVEPPRLAYSRDLVHHYLLAVSSREPMVSFLSYYHIAEHFFEQIYNEEVRSQIRKKIQAPSFSANRELDIAQLVKLVSKLTREQRDDATPVNEQKALELVVSRYVDIAELTESISSLDGSAIAYYKSNKIDFSEGDVIPFGEAENTKIVTSLARRVYKTRNAIVHSKNNDLPRYRPFDHANRLRRELPLLRSLSEAIIISSSDPIT